MNTFTKRQCLFIAAAMLFVIMFIQLMAVVFSGSVPQVVRLGAPLYFFTVYNYLPAMPVYQRTALDLAYLAGDLLACYFAARLFSVLSARVLGKLHDRMAR